MYSICVFAGTTEGRRLIDFLSEQDVMITACVATEYGETLLEPRERLTVSAQRLSEDEMVELFAVNRFDLVIDATHPYAEKVTQSVMAACQRTQTEYMRLLRDEYAAPDSAVFMPDVESAAEYLDAVTGNILLTTGSKELGKFAGISGFAERVYARVLPMQSSLDACREAGVLPAHILAMQGPFSEEMNVATLKSISARYMVTKDGGSAGGFPEKVSAAKKAGVRLVVIGRPPQTEGMGLAQTIRCLSERFAFRTRPLVAVTGIGPGNRAAMTLEAADAIENADCLIGAGRMLKAVARPEQEVFDAIAPGKIADCIAAHPEYRRFAVVMSGDTGFFSGTKKLLPLLSFCNVRVLPGLSSLSYLCARLGASYEDVLPVSLHGRERNIAADVRGNARVFALVGGEDGARRLCRTLCDAGLGDVRVSIGEKLSYPEERITVGNARELSDGSYDALSAVLIENDNPDAIVTHGLPDEDFQRGGSENGVVPMTKSEVRSVCLSKLHLTRKSVCWDVGAGTGSVAIEMAIQASGGQVFAIERREDAIALLRENERKFAPGNLTIVPGTAPEACAELPPPSHVFIGGSSGNMRDILSAALAKNPDVRIVATAIALESIGELNACANEMNFAEFDVVSMSVARSRTAGRYHLMMGQNPVYIFTMQYPEAAQQGQ